MFNTFFKYLKLLDYAIVTYFSSSSRNKVNTGFAIFFSFLASPPGLFIISILLFFINLNLFIDFILTGTICFITVKILKIIFKRIRPIEHIYNDNVVPMDRYSFPSGHAAASFSLSIILIYFFPHLTILFILIAVFISISRVYLLFHYLIDILAGAILGIFTGFFTHLIVFPNLNKFIYPIIKTIKDYLF